MKKNWKTVLMIVVLVALGLGYYYYLSNKEPSRDATESAVANEELAALTTRDIDKNYPESPKEVVKFYARITKAYYKTKLTDEQIETLGRQARLLFDDELKAKQTENEFLTALKEDIASYQSVNRYVSDFKIDGSASVKYMTFEGHKYASLVVLYSIREGSDLHNSYTRYMLRQNSEGQWKILYWELVSDKES